MKPNALPTLILMLATLMPVFQLGAQGPLAPPPGPPAPVMKSLDEIEPRKPISTVPFTLSQPGSYYLTTNLTVGTGEAIAITSGNVTLDLNGFTIQSTAASANGYGIRINGGLQNITIANGFIRGGVTNNGSGVFGGGGFAHGIYSTAGTPVNVLVSRVSVSGCLTHGIVLSGLESTVVESCTVRTVGGIGIRASVVRQAAAYDTGGVAVAGDVVSDCVGSSATNSSGISAGTALNSRGYSVGGDGVSALSASTCQGYTTTGRGIFASTAQNCYGNSSGSGYGIYASRIAVGCHGHSVSGTGLWAFIANVSSGTTTSGTALTTAHNVNSF